MRGPAVKDMLMYVFSLFSLFPPTQSNTCPISESEWPGKSFIASCYDDVAPKAASLRDCIRSAQICPAQQPEPWQVWTCPGLQSKTQQMNSVSYF